ncbi:MAG: hypothetical protein ABI759_22080 [Candidatus Solibacter sp.]
MALQADWSPMKWPKGAFWTQPASLDLIRGSAVNCLLIPWGKAENQTALGPLVTEAVRRGIALVGVVEEGASTGPAAQAAKIAGLAAVATAKPGEAGGFPAVTLAKRSEIPSGKGDTAVAFTDSVWPAVKMMRAGGGNAAGADAGPTGAPWLDSNLWFVQMAKVMMPDRPVWIMADPAAGRVFTRPGGYFIAVADAAQAGGRWVISLDDDFAGGLAKGDAKAAEDWKRVLKAVKFFADHAAWSKYGSLGLVGVLSDFRGENEFLATETLNLMMRRQLPFRAVDKTKLAANSLQGLKAVVYTDEQMPAPAMRQQLTAFARGGGLLICTKKCAALAGDGRALAADNPLFQIHSLGTGRIAVSTEDSIDPFVLAGQTHMLLSRKNDMYRLYNQGSATTIYTGSPDGKKALLQFLSFSAGRIPDLGIDFVRGYRSAVCHMLETDAPSTVNLVRRESSQEVHLPGFPLFCAIELEV